MARWLAAMAVLAIGGSAAAGPDHVSVDVAEEIGVLSSTRTTVTAAYAHRWFGDRAYTEARLGGGWTAGMAVVDARAGVGLIFNRGERVEVLVGWRIGDQYLRGSLADAPYTLNLLAVEVAVQLQVRLDHCWRLRALPVAPTLYWNRTYGGTIGLELGVDRAL